ncbi:MAG TPA: hypothetical protein VMS08_01795 [Candidatus Saccharimonadia bacterium]|nr:hypothetical protein [Candidatus Saccharimonadia bacterium]
MTELLSTLHPVVRAIMDEARATLENPLLLAVQAGDAVNIPYASQGNRGDYHWATLILVDDKVRLTHDHRSPQSPCTSLGALTGETGTWATIRRDMSEHSASD